MRPNAIRQSDYARLPNPVLGPYEYVEWEPGSHITMRAVERWWGGRAPITHVVFRFVPRSESILGLIESGECDLATGELFQITQLPGIEQAAERGKSPMKPFPARRGSAST
jgi:ABC-type transport system substrate-binding protein